MRITGAACSMKKSTFLAIRYRMSVGSSISQKLISSWKSGGIVVYWSSESMASLILSGPATLPSPST